MNLKKFICCFFIIILLTGCSVKYDLTINNDFSVSEKVIASEQTKKLESLTRLKGDSAVEYIYKNYKRDKNIFMNTYTKQDSTITTATTSYNNISDYSNDFKSDIFKKINVKKDGTFVTLTANQSNPLTKNTSYSYIYDDITIKIKVPFKVIENNADSVVNDIYTWKIDTKNNYKNIKLKYDEGSLKDKINLKINEKTYNINYAFVVISGIILLLLIITSVVVVKNKKNNSF